MPDEVRKKWCPQCGRKELSWNFEFKAYQCPCGKYIESDINDLVSIGLQLEVYDSAISESKGKDVSQIELLRSATRRILVGLGNGQPDWPEFREAVEDAEKEKEIWGSRIEQSMNSCGNLGERIM